MDFKIVIVVLLASIYSATGLSLSGHNYLYQKFEASAKFLNLSGIETKWIKQPLDHFNKSETRVWNMKYYENSDYWTQGGPMVLYINGEGPAIAGCISSRSRVSPVGIVEDLVMETQGVMLSSEHRYYGESLPLTPVTVQNLQYLSSRQALADLANLIKEKRQTYTSSKVVVIGGSYAGNLAAWMRLIYPDLVDAAISISGPVLAKVNFFEYLETTGDELKKYAAECFDDITANFTRLNNLLKTDSGINQLIEEENICPDTDMHKRENQEHFLDEKMSKYAFAVQIGTPETIRYLCTRTTTTSMFGMRVDSRTDNVLIPDRAQCRSYDLDVYIRHLYEVKDNLIPWIYQTCTEFGYCTVSPQNDPFSNLIDLDFYYAICTKAFGPSFNAEEIDKSVKKTNAMYGGLNPDVTNVVFVHGDIDPWHKLGILKDLSDTALATVIPRLSHCPLIRYNYNPSNEELGARAFVKDNIKKWIGLSQVENF